MFIKCSELFKTMLCYPLTTRISYHSAYRYVVFSRAESRFMLLPPTVWGGDYDSSHKSMFTFV